MRNKPEILGVLIHLNREYIISEQVRPEGKVFFWSSFENETDQFAKNSRAFNSRKEAEFHARAHAAESWEGKRYRK